MLRPAQPGLSAPVRARLPPMMSADSRPLLRLRGHRVLARWLLGAEWRSHRGRALVAIATIALGVALGYAVQLINSAAFNEFSAAARSLSGEADLQVRGGQPSVDEPIYPLLPSEPGDALASPVLALDVTVPNRSAALPVLGIGTFKASRIAPDL